MGNGGFVTGAEFPTTIWSEVTRAGSPGHDRFRSALEAVLKKYERPLVVHLRSRFQVTEEQARDWFQDFALQKVLQEGVFARACRERGKFRTFLLECLDNFVRSRLRRENASKRRPEGLVALASTEGLPDEPSMTQPDPFLVAWAQEVLVEAFYRMKQECIARSCEQRWQVFEMRVLDPILNGVSQPSFEEIFQRLAFRDPAEASNTLYYAFRRIRIHLDEVLLEYAGPNSSLEEERNEFFRAAAAVNFSEKMLECSQ